jgi:hypothetical protein
MTEADPLLLAIYMFDHISLNFFIARNILDKICRKIKTYFLFKNFFLNRAVYQIMWKNIVKPDAPHLAIWRMRMRTACWISKNTNTHAECGTLIVFPLQQWLQERALLLRYTFITCLVSVSNLVTTYSNHWALEG